MSKELEKLIAMKFIQRRDVKAVQTPDGKWAPDNKFKGHPHGLGFDMASLERHLTGQATYGHYLLDTNSHARVMCFDIDLEPKAKEDMALEKKGNYVILPQRNLDNVEFEEQIQIIEDVDPRALWQDRTATDARKWYKAQMMMLARKFVKAVTEELGIGAAAAYSGSKGVHVYGFTGDMPASEVREGALIVMDALGEFELSRGDHFWKHMNTDPIQGFQNFQIEIFPKQDTLDDKSYGNLVRLPLGKNQKSADPTFFLDLKAPAWEMRPHPDPIELLTTGNPYV